MIPDYLGVDSPPELFTMADATFAALEGNKRLRLIEYREPQWIVCDPAPRMPELYLPMTPPQWELVLGALLLGGGDRPDPLLPALKLGRLGVFNAALYAPNLSTMAKREFYSVGVTRTIIRHREGTGSKKRRDAIQTFYDLHGVPQNASARVGVHFRKEVQGGELSAVCLWEVHYAAGPLLALGVRVTAKVRARNANQGLGIQETVRREIRRQASAAGFSQGRVNELLAIAWQESKFHQFETARTLKRREGLPMQGSSKNDWGVFQLNTLPFPDSAAEGYGPIMNKGQVGGWPPTREQLWDFRANIAGGIRLYAVKIKEAEAYLRKLYRAAMEVDPKGARRPTARQNRLECLERFNGGAYWSRWSPEKRAWVRRPPKRPPYADALIGVVEGLEGKPTVVPRWWNFE